MVSASSSLRGRRRDKRERGRGGREKGFGKLRCGQIAEGSVSGVNGSVTAVTVTPREVWVQPGRAQG
jgi:hypothetical protein